MFTCGELDAFVDKLCDITVDMDNMERAREASHLLQQVQQVPVRFLMQMRAAAVADLHYLDGQRLRKIAPQVGHSFQAVSTWLREYGPSHYLTLVQRDGTIQPVLFQVAGEFTKTKVRQYRAAGHRIAPATWNLVDLNAPDRVRTGTDLDDIWEKLGD